MKYLQLTFYSFTGIKKIIDLGDFSYAEWIVYDNDVPKYHINLYTELKSDMMINSILNKKENTIEGILKNINTQYGTKLSLTTRPLIMLLKKEELVELDLGTLPEQWVKNIIQ
ncbi:hypothetical protein JN11_00635 [Mucilaginibacter frigoritolerans]|uniref:Uncharacterized protein n=1 Tax=Mucilaginibacter frigoritolerans TaxID=652788 RepID=A0A562UGD9_9SPHI|nr:hypothetical protein [Mucilaginibacter frigoritolerans]TWJ04912.1 hypothetical protein JN11_00635 [Mucilaginibacter frigoritolerans]